jgi:hypothetical protein
MIRHFDIIVLQRNSAKLHALIIQKHCTTALFGAIKFTFGLQIRGRPEKILLQLSTETVRTSNYSRMSNCCLNNKSRIMLYILLCTKLRSAKIVFPRYSLLFRVCFIRECIVEASFDSFDWQLNETSRKIKVFKIFNDPSFKPTRLFVTRYFSSSFSLSNIGGNKGRVEVVCYATNQARAKSFLDL